MNLPPQSAGIVRTGLTGHSHSAGILPSGWANCLIKTAAAGAACLATKNPLGCVIASAAAAEACAGPASDLVAWILEPVPLPGL
jgi:hypothetical protein